MSAVTPPVPKWQVLPGYQDIVYAKADEGIAKITINRPEVRNAFRPETVTSTGVLPASSLRIVRPT